MPLKKVYRTGGKDLLASADFYELAANKSFVTFYLADVIVGSDTLDQILTQNPIYSNNGWSEVANATKTIEFDLNFEIPVTMEGDANFWIPVAIAGGGTPTMVWTAKIFHVNSAATETQIGSTITRTITSVAAANWIFSGQITMTKKTFKQGEKFRFEVAVTSDTVGETGYFYYDPKDRTSEAVVNHTVTRQSLINLPIKIPE